MWASLFVSMSCAEALPFHLVLVAWFYCMFVWVCSHVIRLGHHVVFTGLLVWCTARFRNLCILFLFVAVIWLLQVVFIKLLLLSHGLLLHFYYSDIPLESAVAGQLST